MPDLSYIFSNLSSSQDPAYAHLTDKDATTDTLLSNSEQGPPPIPPSQDQSQQPTQGLGDRVMSAAKSAGNLVGKNNPNVDKTYGFNYVPHALWSHGMASVSEERTQPPARSRPAQSEDARAIWHQWYSDMKTFANSGK